MILAIDMIPNRNQAIILAGFAEALAAPESIWSLINSGFKVIAFSRSRRVISIGKGKHIKCIKVCSPEIDILQSINDITSLIVDNKPDFIMPLDDSGLWVCNAVSSQLNINNIGPNDYQAEFALNKRLQIEIAKECGLRVIPSRFITAISDFYRVTELPVIFKPTMARFVESGRLKKGRHFRCLDKRKMPDVAKKWNEAYPMVAQPIIQGAGEGIFGLSTADGVKAWTAHRRIRMMDPLGSGSSACESIDISDQPIDLIELMIRTIKWRGLFMVEMIRDNMNQLWFMELNGRPWGSMALARRQGYEYPAWSVLTAIDQHYEPVLPRPFAKIVCRHLGREIMHVLMVIRNHRIFSLSSWTFLAKTLIDILRIRQNQKWYNWERGKTCFFVKDTFLTVIDAFKKAF